MQLYQPSAQVLENYASVLVNFALNSGKGVNPGEVVQISVPDIAKPLALALQNTVLKAGAQPMIRLLPTGFDKDFFSLASQEQLRFFPAKLLKARAELLDHQIGIIADVNPRELAEVDPTAIFTTRNAQKPYRDWLIKKETESRFTWTLALWGVQAKADEVGLSLEEYWQQIIQACFLDAADPIAEWRNVFKQQQRIKKILDEMKIEKLEIVGPDAQLVVKLGAERIWKAGGGRNVPSFEFFTSPDWRGTEGWITFNQPLYRYGNVIKNISLTFNKGVIVKAHADEGNKLLQQLLKTENADKIGEFSLTDKRMSRITHVMAETLFDENIGGPFGNTHLAVGMAYKDCYRGNAAKVTKAQWKKMGYNDSAEHTDIISTTDRTVTAQLADGSKVVIYKDGQFVV